MKNNLDYSATYFMPLDFTEVQDGIKLKKGLNIYTKPFNMNPNNFTGGFLFTTFDNIITRFDSMTWIRKVIIPKDATVVETLYPGVYKTNKIICDKRLSRIQFAKYTNLFNYLKTTDKQFYARWPLRTFCNKYFKFWWNENDFDWKNYSNDLCELFPDHIYMWWNEDKFNWLECSFDLAYKCNKYFNLWWNKDKFNYKDYSFALATYCSEYFNLWWDKDKFNYDHASTLAKYCPQFFDVWWYDMIKPNQLIPLKYYTNNYNFLLNLLKYCPKYASTWMKCFELSTLPNTTLAELINEHLTLTTEAL